MIQGIDPAEPADTLTILRLLWPVPCVVTEVTRPLPSGSYALLPHRRRPTRVVPVVGGRVSASLVTGTMSARGGRAKARRLAVAAGGAVGALRGTPSGIRIVEPDDASTVRTYLRDALGEEVCVAVHLGPPRANRKPVLHVVDRRGSTLAFAKIGINSLTDRLVNAEHAALGAIQAARLGTVRAPSVISFGTWQGHPVLIQSPVDATSGTEVPEALLRAAFVEVSRAAGTQQSSLTQTPGLKRLAADLATASSPDAAALADRLRRLLDTTRSLVWTTGVWHGDWTPWNTGLDGTRAAVWDWERLESGVPLGIDAVHFHTQRAIRAAADPLAATRSVLLRREDLLAPWGLSTTHATATCAAYLLLIGARYAVDDQRASGARLGRLDTWLLPALDELLRDLSVRT